MLDVLKFLPNQISDIIRQNNLEGLEEIRIKVNKPIILKFLNREIVINYYPKQEEILNTLQFICDNSIYSYQNQICEGYITIIGGHRVRNNRRCSIRKRKSKKHIIYI